MKYWFINCIKFIFTKEFCFFFTFTLIKNFSNTAITMKCEIVI